MSLATASPRARRNIVWVSLALVVGGLALTIAAIALRASKGTRTTFDYGVVLDAGSSHTVLYVYTWAHRTTPGTERVGSAPALSQHKWACKSKAGGISSFSSGADAAATILPLLNCALDLIPSAAVPTTPIYLGATAGMRLLSAQNASLADDIMRSVCSVLAKSPFNSAEGTCRILSGAEEGLYGWTTANYLLDNFFMSPLSRRRASSITPAESLCVGALDLGGASTQITFVSEDPAGVPLPYRQDLSLFSVEYRPYAQSYLGLGLDQARAQMETNLVLAADPNATFVGNPCLPVGYNRTASNWPNITLYGTGDARACLTATEALIAKTACACDTCGIGDACQPPVRGNFLAFAGYAFAAAYVNISNDVYASPADLGDRSDVLCGSPWHAWVKTPGVPLFVTANSCFSAKFAYSLLVRGYGVPVHSPTVMFSTTVGGSDTGWALGFILDESGVLPVFARDQYPVIGSSAFGGMLSAGLILLAMGVAGVVLVRCRRPEATAAYTRIAETSEG